MREERAKSVVGGRPGSATTASCDRNNTPGIYVSYNILGRALFTYLSEDVRAFLIGYPYMAGLNNNY